MLTAFCFKKFVIVVVPFQKSTNAIPTPVWTRVHALILWPDTTAYARLVMPETPVDRVCCALLKFFMKHVYASWLTWWYPICLKCVTRSFITLL